MLLISSKTNRKQHVQWTGAVVSQHNACLTWCHPPQHHRSPRCWRNTPGVRVFRRWKQRNKKLKVILGDAGRWRPAWDTCNPVSKQYQKPMWWILQREKALMLEQRKGLRLTEQKDWWAPDTREQLLSLWERVLNCVRKLVLFRAWRSQVQTHYWHLLTRAVTTTLRALPSIWTWQHPIQIQLARPYWK